MDFFPYNPVKHKRLQAPTQFVPGRVRHPCFFLRAAYDNSYQSILLTFHFIRICIANRHWQVEKYYLILMTLLVRRIRSVEPEVNLLGHPSLPSFYHPLPQTTLRLTEMHGESQYNNSISWVNPEHA